MLEALEGLKYIKFRLDGAVAVLTINRPESLNALNLAVVGELEAALSALDAEEGVKAVILTGAGEKAFAAGGDIREMQGLDVEAARRFSRAGQGLVQRISEMRKPVLAAVNGYALGGGLELALACDFIYASESARFGLPEVTLGLLPGFGGTQTLARAIGPARAKELVFTGRVLTAQEALEWGIANAILPADRLLELSLVTARQIARNGSVAVANARRAILQGAGKPLEAGLRVENELFAELFATEDRAEGLRAFLEKRPAQFKGK